MEEEGVAPGKFQFHPVGVPLLMSVKLMQEETQMLWSLVPSAATGDEQVETVIVTWSVPVHPFASVTVNV